MLTRDQANSLSRVAYNGNQKKLQAMPREKKGIPVEHLGGGLRSAAARKLSRKG